MDHRLWSEAATANLVNGKPGADAAEVKSRIESALKRNSEVHARNIKVSMIDDGRVALTGKVQDWQEREAVTSAAWSVNGILSVEDRLSFN